MAQFQSEIELRVKVVDRDLNRLEERIKRLDKKPGVTARRASGVLRNSKAVLQVEKNRLQLQTKLTGQAVKQLNLNTSWLKALQQAKTIRAGYAKDAEKAAKSAEREKRAVERTAALNKKKRSNRFEGAALGAGFPLLFGGGIGQSAAGLAGSLLGPSLGLGSMGGGIAAQAVVAGITQATTALTETAAVAGSVGDAYDFLTEKALFASDETQALADKLAELGDVERLAEAVTQELVNLIGNEGVQNLKALDDEVDTFQKEIGKLGLAIGAFLSQYLTPLIEKFNSVLGTINTANEFAAREKDIAGTDREAEFKKRVEELTTPGARGSKIFGEAQQKILLKEFPAIVEKASKIDPTFEDRKRFAPPAPKSGRAGRKPYDPTKRIADLTAEAALIRKIADQNTLINNAQIDRDEKLRIELKLQQELERIEANRVKMLRNSKAPGAEEGAINALAEAKAYKATAEAAGKVAAFDAKNVKSTEKQLTQMALQTELADALTREEQKQLKLQIALLRVKEANIGKTDEQIKALQAATKALFEAQNKGPLETYINQLQVSLSDTEAQVVQLAKSIEGSLAQGLSSAITGLIDGTKSVEEAFANMFAGIGKAFIDMATQMIAKALVMKALGILTGGASSGGGGGGDIFSQLSGQGYDFSYAGGGYTGDGARSGGIDGQGGFPAILHPQETVVDHYGDARSAMTSSASIAAAFAESSEAMTTASSNYAYNSATNSYSTSSNSSSVNNGSGASAGSTSTIMLETNVINQVEYATVDEVNKKMQQSAKQAEASVYRNMRNKPAVRGRTGV